MAGMINRRNRHNVDIWPGFVDAIATLLMVIIFLLMIFVISQMYLSEELAGRDKALDRLTLQITNLTEELSLEKTSNETLSKRLDTVALELKSSLFKNKKLDDNLANLQVKYDSSSKNNMELNSKNSVLELSLSDAYKVIDTSVEKIKLQLDKIVQLDNAVLALEALQEELTAELIDKNLNITETTKNLKQKTDELSASREEILQARAETSLLNKQIRELNNQLKKLSELLDIAAANDLAADAQIASLGKRLNAALASKVHELAGYRSEFFGELKKILGTQSDIKIVGDRFVFQSEIFFASASDELESEGKKQLARLALSLIEIAKKIPEDINWILMIEGHTDSRPIKTTRFPSNWELSTARAISVAQFLYSVGIPKQRLATAGYAEFQPLIDINASKSVIDKSRIHRINRRIELKLTQR